MLDLMAIDTVYKTIGLGVLINYRRISRIRNVSYSIAIVRPFEILFLTYRAFLIYGGKCCKLYIKLYTLYT